MAVVAIEGFDAYSGVGVAPGVQARWVNVGGGGFHALLAGRFGGQCWYNNQSNNTTYIRLLLPAAYGSATLGCAVQFFSALPTSVGVCKPAIIFWGTGGTVVQLGIQTNLNGAIEVWRLTGVAAGTLLGTSAAGVVVLGAWHYLEVELTISDTVGVVNVYVDSVSVLALTAQDTRNGTPTTVDAVSFGQHSNLSGSGTCLYDDVYVTDSAAKLGERRVDTLYPTADVTGATDWTQSTGANRWSAVDEAQVATADYISATTVGNTERFTHGGLASTPASINAVQVIAWGLKTDATARSIAVQVKSGATTVDGANFSLASTVTQLRRDLLLTDPNTAAAWTAAAVNALEFGVKVTV